MTFPAGETTERRFVGGLPFWNDLVDRSLIAARIAAGARSENTITNDVFFARHPELPRVPLRREQTELAAEWLDIRDRLVRPALARAAAPAGGAATVPAGGAAADVDVSSADVPLGTLTSAVPGRPPFSYRFTRDDVLTTARFLVAEAGGRDNAENRGTLWAMLNRCAFFRNKTPGWGSFGGFLKQYSQTLQPFIKHWVSVKDFVAKCNDTFDNPGCLFRPTHTTTYPGTQVPMGQLTTFLALQATPWEKLPASARGLALRALTGRIPNQVGNATEVADTKVYFKRANGRVPTRAEWEAYTRAWVAQKEWAWRPEQVPYDQFGHNALFVTKAARSFPEGANRIIPPPAGLSTAPAPTPAPVPTTAPAPAPAAHAPGVYDGSTPAPGTVETRRSFPTNPPLRNDASNRSVAAYDNVINQFAVGVNPRYAHRNGATYCNIFAWDLTRAMNAEIPHWVDPHGDPTPHLHGNELNANALNDWLHRHGGRYGWRLVARDEAVGLANQGCPVVASWKKPGGIGHIAVIRPGVATAAEGPWMAQAGATNSNRIRMFKVWRKSSGVETWTHA